MTGGARKTQRLPVRLPFYTKLDFKLPRQFVPLAADEYASSGLPRYKYYYFFLMRLESLFGIWIQLLIKQLTWRVVTFSIVLFPSFPCKTGPAKLAQYWACWIMWRALDLTLQYCNNKTVFHVWQFLLAKNQNFRFILLEFFLQTQQSIKITFCTYL